MRYDHTFRENGFHSAFLTTFSFDPIAFENVTLLNLRNSGCRNIAVLADMDMTNIGLSEIGTPMLAGLDYHLAKRFIGGAFHPKIVLKLGYTSGSLLVGSSNLTTAGMVGNLEAFSEIRWDRENTTTASIFAAALSYFQSHIDPKDISMRRALDRAKKETPWLVNVSSETVLAREDQFKMGFFCDTPDASIADQLLEQIGDDRINRLIVVSPYADGNLRGLQKLRGVLGNPETDLIPDLTEQDFTWETVSSANGITLRSSEELGVSRTRRLHTKIIMACGERADYILTGSMNASEAGLFGRGKIFGNAEAATFRTVEPGTGLDLLGNEFQACLQSEFLANMMSIRDRVKGSERKAVSRLPDGGSLEMKRLRIRWRPHKQDGLGKRLVLYGDIQAQNYSINIENASDTEWYELIEGVEFLPRYGVIEFKDGSLSAPVAVAHIDTLERSAHAPKKRGDMEILDALAEGDDISMELHDLLIQMDCLSLDSQVPKMRKNRQVNESNGNVREELAQPLSEADFFAIEERAKDATVHAQRISTLQDIRRYINSQSGSLLSALLDESAESRLADIDVDVRGTDENGNRDSRSYEDTQGNKLTKKSKRLVSSSQKKEALQFAESLDKSITRMHKVLKLQNPGDLTDAQGLMFRIVTLAILNVSSEAGPTVQHPLPPLPIQEVGGWIRMLGRLIVPHLTNWTCNTLLNSDLNDAQMEALALASATSVLLIHATELHGAPPPVLKPIADAASGFHSAIQKWKLQNASRQVEFERMIEEEYCRKSFQRLMGRNASEVAPQF